MKENRRNKQGLWGSTTRKIACPHRLLPIFLFTIWGLTLFLLLRAEETGVVQLKATDVYLQPFDLAQYRGRVVVFYFTNKAYASQRSPKYSAGSVEYAFNQNLQLVLVFSPKGVPKIARSTFRKKLIERISHEEQKFAQKAKADGKNPAQIVLTRYLTDWNLALHTLLGMDPKEETFSIAVFDQKGHLQGRFKGEDHYQEAVKRVESLLK